MRAATLQTTRHTWAPLAVLALLAACTPAPPVTSPAQPLGGPTISLRDDWSATVLVERDDSIILTLPSGDRQLQQFHRSAVFTLVIARDGTVSLRLDSLKVLPRDDSAGAVPLLAAWTGRADDPRVNALRVSAGGELADELTAIVRNLLPRFPVAGAHAQTTWTDSADGTVRVDIFTANERRTATWTVGTASRDATGTSLPVRVREDYEQIGSGSQGRGRITMTSQGSRSGIYYSTVDGRLMSARLTDSATMLISLPDTRQVVPTVRFGRSSVRFIPIPRDSSEE